MDSMIKINATVTIDLPTTFVDENFIIMSTCG